MTSDDGMTITETLSQAVTRQAAEIERLREELDRSERFASLTVAASSVAGEAVRKMNEAEAEAEQLRQLAELREKQLDTHIAALINAEAEIERLRGLLRDLLVSETLTDVWHLRVREALGE
jgi:hypothetical protein